ncbi:MAG: hypothetical protein EHM40_12875 [Chloroflexi bacterium]|nr:MAG: hypothetical protein EHM40_12875 [Chloroflexota bacterium]
MQIFLKRPLSLIAAILAVLVIVYELIQIASGELYQEALNNMDGTTLIELGILMLLGVYTLRDRSDLHAVSFTLVAGLSFIFIYEAIYKWSFFLAPFVEYKDMPPHEVREFIIQSGIALTILTGFAVGDFRVTKWTFVWLGSFVILYAFWLLVGFPQVLEDNKLYYEPVIPIEFTSAVTYVVNRGTKFFMYLAYLTIFPPLKRRDVPLATLEKKAKPELTGNLQDA